MCLDHIQRIERQEGIPRNLLLAMARVESGRWDKDSQDYRAWPWTVNVAGKAHYLRSRTDAVDLVTRYIKEGVTNIDVGCMQLNVNHHLPKFSSVTEMLDPAKNVRYAAKFLRHLKVTEKKPWSEAVGNYHSRTQIHHSRYKAKVYETLNTVNQSTKSKKPVKPEPGQTILAQSSGSLYSYERRHGWTKAQTRPTKTIGRVKATQHKRAVLMKSKGVKDTRFMESKNPDSHKPIKSSECKTCKAK